MTVTVSLTRPGKGTTEFAEELVVDQPDVKILLLEQFSFDPIYHRRRLILGSGAPIVWFVFPHEWYAVGRFHKGPGEFTGWYTNICTPFDTTGSRWRTTDLFLDLWQDVAGGAIWLDEDELAAAASSGMLDVATQNNIQKTRETISRAHEGGRWPPQIARTFTIEQAREALNK